MAVGIERVLVRLLSGTGAIWGLAQLTRPRDVVARLCPEFPESRMWVVRVLGARLVAQHAVVLAAPERTVIRLASAVDLLHAASMLPLLASPRYRRAAAISGGIAAGYAVLASVVGGRADRR